MTLPSSNSLRRVLAVGAASLVMLAIGADRVAARPDPGEAQPAPRVSAAYPDPGRCPLMRIGTQLVRCDTPTGAGVSAPLWLPELGVDPTSERSA